MNLVPIENNKSLYRDSQSGAVVNCSSSDYEQYIQHKNQELEKLSEMEKLKNDVNEIKDIMKLILSKLDTNS